MGNVRAVSPLPAAEIPAQDNNPMDPVRKRSRTTTRLGALRIPRPSTTTFRPAPIPTSKNGAVDTLTPYALPWLDVSEAVTSDTSGSDTASVILDVDLDEACKTMSDESSSGISDAELEEAC